MPIAIGAAAAPSRDEIVRNLTQSYDGQKNVVGTQLKPCTDHDDMKVSGWQRDGYCGAAATDRGLHVVCCSMTESFLRFAESQGNNLRTPRPPYFWGLAPGDHWCICAHRWLEAYQADAAPDVFLECTHEAALRTIPLDFLKNHALDLHRTHLADRRSPEHHLHQINHNLPQELLIAASSSSSSSSSWQRTS